MKTLPTIDDLWNYGKPQETEKRFLALLEQRNNDNLAYFLEVETQLARTQSLQRNFAKAHNILDAVESQMKDEMTVVRIRYLLERGRTYNSAKEKESAKKLFEDAFYLSEKNKQDFYAVDAAHMLGIVYTYPKNVAWNEKAKQVAEKSEDARARKWLGALYNNIGWTYHDNGDYLKALDNFKKAVVYREAQKNVKGRLIAKWCVGRCLRSLGRVEEALHIQKNIKEERENNDLEGDGYVYEELGELCLLLEKKEESKPYFAQAYKLLSQDIWMKANEVKRLERLQELSK